jgi:hypothetical protein
VPTVEAAAATATANNFLSLALILLQDKLSMLGTSTLILNHWHAIPLASAM